MLKLAVATAAETLERMQDPLADRGVRAEHFQSRERTFTLTKPAFDSFDVGFVFPPRVMEGGVVDAGLNVPWVNDREAVLTSRNKAEVIARLSRAGLPVPETVMVSNPVPDSELVDAFTHFDSPVVVKPNSATQGVGVTLAQDLDSFLGIADYFTAIHEFEPVGDRSFLLQEYLADARDYRAMVIGGQYVGAVERKLPQPAANAGRWKRNVHRDARAVAVSLPGQLRELAERTATTLGIDYLGVDILETQSRVVISETNARPTIDAASKYEPSFYDKLASVIKAQVE